MPTLEAGSRYDNIKRSVNAHLVTNVATALSVVVYYDRQGRQGSLPAQWVEAHLITTSYQSDVIVAGWQSHSTHAECYLNLNLFEKIDSGLGLVGIYGLDTLADNVRQVYELGSTVVVYDYATVGNPAAGHLRVLERPSVREIDTPADMGARQTNISVPMRYLATTID